MKRVTDAVKKFFIWLGSVVLGVISFFSMHKYFLRHRHGSSISHYTGYDTDNFEKKEVKEIEKLAEIRRKEISDYISNTSPSDISAGCEAVRGAIDRGIERFRERCSQYRAGDEDSGGRNKEN